MPHNQISVEPEFRDGAHFVGDFQFTAFKFSQVSELTYFSSGAAEAVDPPGGDGREKASLASTASAAFGSFPTFMILREGKFRSGGSPDPLEQGSRFGSIVRVKKVD